MENSCISYQSLNKKNALYLKSKEKRNELLLHLLIFIKINPAMVMS